MSEFWREINIAEGECRLWRSGPCGIWVWRRGSEWSVAGDNCLEPGGGEGEVAGELVEPPADLEWSRWRGHESAEAVKLVPAMPDRPLVVRPVLPLHILPGSRAEFFVSIPLWLRVVVGSGRTVDILEMPSQILSNIWFGAPTEGELCYSLSTRARTEKGVGAHGILSAVCPVLIVNEHTDPLNFERLCLRAEYLSTYRLETDLITNGIRMGYRGIDQPSRVKYFKRVAEAYGAATKIADSRRPIEENLLKKSFSSLMGHNIEA